MKPTSVLRVLGSVCFLLADAFPVSEEEPPEIIGPSRIRVKAHRGELLVLNCEAFPNCERELTTIYWIINSSFPEDVDSSERVVESQESTLENGTILQRSLLLKNVTSEDLKSRFTCVVSNPVGTAQKHITLVPTRQEKRGRKKQILKVTAIK